MGTRKEKGFHVFNVAKGLGSMFSPSATTTSPHDPHSPSLELAHHPSALAHPTEICAHHSGTSGARVGRKGLPRSYLPHTVLDQSRSFLVFFFCVFVFLSFKTIAQASVSLASP